MFYDAAKAFVAAIENIDGELTREAIAQKLRQIKFGGALATCSLIRTAIASWKIPKIEVSFRLNRTSLPAQEQVTFSVRDEMQCFCPMVIWATTATTPIHRTSAPLGYSGTVMLFSR